jgi:hypothetical protein
VPPRASRAPSPTVPATGEEIAPLEHSLAGGTDDGGPIAVTLAWAAPDAVPADGYRVDVQVDDEVREIAVDDGSATSVRLELAVGLRHDIGIAVRDGAAVLGPRAAWPPLTPARHQETSSLARYTGAWRTAEGPSLSGGTVAFTRGPGARVVVRFTGRDIAWVATRTPASGRAEVRLDGESIGVVDLRADEVQYRRIVFRHHLAELGSHRLEIRALGDGRVDVDAFLVLR